MIKTIVTFCFIIVSLAACCQKQPLELVVKSFKLESRDNGLNKLTVKYLAVNLSKDTVLFGNDWEKIAIFADNNHNFVVHLKPYVYPLHRFIPPEEEEYSMLLERELKMNIIKKMLQNCNNIHKIPSSYSKKCCSDLDLFLMFSVNLIPPNSEIELQSEYSVSDKYKNLIRMELNDKLNFIFYDSENGKKYILKNCLR